MSRLRLLVFSLIIGLGTTAFAFQPSDIRGLPDFRAGTDGSGFHVSHGNGNPDFSVGGRTAGPDFSVGGRTAGPDFSVGGKYGRPDFRAGVSPKGAYGNGLPSFSRR